MVSDAIGKHRRAVYFTKESDDFFMDTNKVILTGNLTRDVELKATPTGKMVANFTIASNRVYKPVSGEQKKEVMFTRIIAWEAWARRVLNSCARVLRLWLLAGFPVGNMSLSLERKLRFSKL